MIVAEMRMLRWMSGVERENRIRNENVRNSVGVVSIVDKLRENRLRRLGYVIKRGKTKINESDYEINIYGKRGRGRPKKRWSDTIE